MGRSQLVDRDTTVQHERRDLRDGSARQHGQAGQPGIPEGIFERYAGAFRAIRAEAPDVSSGAVLR